MLDEAAKRNRQRFPLNAMVVDEFRSVFGPGVRIRYLSEGGNEMGKRGSPGVPITLQYKGNGGRDAG